MVGIKDVAALAGVSISTVSYVMTGKRPIGVKTRQRVLQAARDLGYLAKNGSPASLDGETHFVALSSPVHDSTSYTNYCAYFLNLGLRTFSWRLSERFLVCSVLRSVRGRWSYTSQRR